MSIVALQTRARRLGEIRLGDTETKSGKTFPISLDMFRLTSSAKGLLDQAALLWGGEVVPWQSTPGMNPKWQLVTETDELPVLIPAQDVNNLSWYELWSAGGLQRHCDGESLMNRDDPIPCVCNPEDRECKPITRVSFMLPDLPDIGVWLLSSTGYNAAVELGATVAIIVRQMADTGWLPEATLAIEHREKKIPDQPPHKFVVPVIRTSAPLREFLESSSPPALAHQGGPEEEGGEDYAPPVAEGSPANPPALLGPEFRITTAQELLDRDGIAPKADVPDDDGVDVTDPGETWDDLMKLLNDDPAAGTMPEIQMRVYALFALMHSVELWGENARAAALQNKYGHEHLTDLRKPGLVTFATAAWLKAKEDVEKAEA